MYNAGIKKTAGHFSKLPISTSRVFVNVPRKCPIDNGGVFVTVRHGGVSSLRQNGPLLSVGFSVRRGSRALEVPCHKGGPLRSTGNEAGTDCCYIRVFAKFPLKFCVFPFLGGKTGFFQMMLFPENSCENC